MEELAHIRRAPRYDKRGWCRWQWNHI